MQPSRPYLVRSLWEWILDNDCTPHIVVDALQEGVFVPEQFIQDGQIILNISPSSVVGFEFQEHALSFNARFGGVPMQVYVPFSAVLAIYARENGQGMGFGMEPGADFYEQQLEAADDDSNAGPELGVADPEQDAAAAQEAPKPPKRGKPSLKVVK